MKYPPLSRYTLQFCSLMFALSATACGASTPLGPAPLPTPRGPDGGVSGDSGIGPLNRDPGPNNGRPCALIGCSDLTVVRVLSLRGGPTSDVSFVVTDRSNRAIATCVGAMGGGMSMNCRLRAPGVFEVTGADSLLGFVVSVPDGPPTRFEAAPMYVRQQPNGPGCEPVCFSNFAAQVDLQLR